MEGRIFEVKRFAVHDGDGIRTTVFFKGCPLKCVWCHNPEGIGYAPQLAYYRHKCLGCGECTEVCPVRAHRVEGGVHIWDRSACIACGNCARNCPGNALALYGKTITAEELSGLLLEDREFYVNSGGGVTLSGGECLMQADFCAELLKALKKENIHTAVDTCGFVAKEAIDKVMAYTDHFLYDIKAIDKDVHIRCTGQDNALILENLKYIDSAGKKIEIRIPFVPGRNDGQMAKIADLVKTLKNVTAVKVLPYHNFAGSKYEALGMENTLPTVLPTKEQIARAEQIAGADGGRSRR